MGGTHQRPAAAPLGADDIRAEESLPLRLVGELDASTIEHMTEVARRALSKSVGVSLVVDITDLVFCDSSGLRALMAIRRAALQAHRAVLFSDARPIVRRVFELTGFADVLAGDGPGEPSVA